MSYIPIYIPFSFVKRIFTFCPFASYLFLNNFIYLFVCFIYLFYLFIYLFMAALGLRCYAWAFSSCGKRGLLIAVASLVEHRL